ncbi:hypothetical protein F5146DRAFT_1006339 [Armillaria mellea]|nr:hypothetical protein F5146DRAFT_1006339 [Armillaria mellea]
MACHVTAVGRSLLGPGIGNNTNSNTTTTRDLTSTPFAMTSTKRSATAPVKHTSTQTKKQHTEEPKKANSNSDQLLSNPRTRPRRGVFANITEIPLDVFFEGSSTFVWKNARENVNLPPLPDDMSEPQYASLAFDNYCQCCFKSTKPPRIPATFLPGYCSRKRCKTFYLTPSINELEELPCHGRGNWFDCKDASSHRRFVRHSDACKKWASDRAVEHADKLQSLRIARAVIERLTALRWGKEIDAMIDGSVLRRHKLVWQIKRLPIEAGLAFRCVSRLMMFVSVFLVWSTMEPAMIELMESL